MKNACLVLDDGSVFSGIRFGAQRETVCEVVFSTGLTGYVELLTDASFCGQAVTMAHPVVGNYGVFEDVSESNRLWVGALIVRDLTRIEKDERGAEDLDAYLKRNDVPGLRGVDTRALTLKIREEGTRIGCITDGTPESLNMTEIFEKIRAYSAQNLVPRVSPKNKQFFPAWKQGWDSDDYTERRENGEKTRLSYDAEPDEEKEALFKVALIDFGAKRNIVWNLTRRGCDVTDYPWDTPAEEIVSGNPDGIFLSNGPGDPRNCGSAIVEIRKLIEAGIPMMGVCLGHQLVALALGAKTEKLKYGHRGANHPVKELETDRVTMTSQNHGYVVTEESVPEDRCMISHVNVNDGSVEGLKLKDRPVFTVQYHPEGAPGPQDNNYLFDRFVDLMTAEKNKRSAL
ncbi:MAG: glutamine-hydrolyzing carbamoyl-phosphate synthase small subunit [Clostridiales bacterium]|nr:glutamine-hydrolyzing carbamoyl-phosphate synthase small subunit [Clostridiales bacterium]